MRTMVWAIGLVLAGGCFTDPGGTGGFVTTSGTSTGVDTAPTSTGGDTGPSTSTSTSTGSTGPEDPTTTSTTAGGEGADCDPWAQDCNAGLKCVPYADDGGDSWNDNKCTPVGEGLVGGPCIAMMSATSGYDTCGPGAICWEVNPDTLAGVCYALCGGSPNTPICPPNNGCSMINDGVVNVCLGTCDPLLKDCDAGQVCVPDNVGQFLCVAGVGDFEVGAACTYINECAEGSMCFDSLAATQLCDQQESGCCLPFCSLKDPTCPVGLECVSYYEGRPPSEHADLGLCQDPV